MLSKWKNVCRNTTFAVMICSAQLAYAHQPDLSSLMIYDQQGKSLLVIKSSLSAFESEIKYAYPHVSFQSPEEFQELVIQHFYKKCLLVVNDDTIRFSHPKVMLGHETTLVAEIENLPNKIESLYIQNMVFGDIYNSVCEVILSKSDLAQKQFLLNADNNREARLVVENGSWVISETKSHWLTKSMLVFASLLIGSLALIYKLVVNRNKNSFLPTPSS